MKQALLFALSLICAYSFAQNPNNTAIVDLALISGNVKYYYPIKHIKPSEWNKVNSYVLHTWQVAPTIAAPTNIYADIQQKYAEAGITINLYKTKPPITAYTKQLLKGKHWEYTGYGNSKNTFLLGPLAWFYNLFLSPYSKKLKRNDEAYTTTYSSSPNLSYTPTETLVKLHDSLWLGMPIKPGKHTPTEAYNNYIVKVDEKYIHFKLTYLADLWNILYHFSPTQDNKAIWLERLNMVIGEAQTDSSLYNTAFKLTSLINDAHVNVYNPYRLPGKFYNIDGNIYYRAFNTDTERANVWRVLRYNGKSANSVYEETMKLVSSPSLEAKSFLALQEMASLRDTNGIYLHVQDINTLDTFLLKIYAQLEKGENKRTINPNNVIQYIDLKHAGGAKIIRALKSPTCKALIIDVRGHAYANTSFIGHFITAKMHHFNMVTPIYKYPDKTLLTYDTITEYIKPKKHLIDKPLAVLCDEASISSSETMLSALAQCPNVTIIGKHSAGTTGNAVVAPIYINGKMYDYLPFTPTTITDKNSNIFTGIVPDITVNKTLGDLKKNEDEIYNAAIEYLDSLVVK